MTDLAHRDFSRSRAVLMGTWEYQDFDQVPAVNRSFHRMLDLLHDPVCGPWPNDDSAIRLFANRPTLDKIRVELIDTFLEATDVLFFYYVGHGIYDHRERLHLTVGDTRTDTNYVAATGLPFEAVRDAFRASKATVKIAVLDCCYAGLATEEYGRLSASRLPPVSGAYVLMSSSAFETSWHEPETVADAQTCFTKALVQTVREGIPGAPTQLTFDHIFTVVADRLIEDGRPEPGRRIEDHAANWVFANNNSPDLPTGPATDLNTVFQEAYRQETRDGIERLPMITATYRAAAEAGHAPSMNRLGQIAEGRIQARMQGVEPGPITGKALLEATHWYTKASEAGDPVGPLHLGQLYEQRYKDPRQAVFWYDLAARRGNGAAKELLAGLRQRIRLGIASTDPETVRHEKESAPTRPRPTAETSRQGWLADWDGSTALATAQCLDVLLDACGGPHGEWSTLTTPEQERVLIDFLAQRPPKATLARAARDYYNAAGPGKLRDHAAGLPRTTPSNEVTQPHPRRAP
ncbi:peptidase C14 caspase catalytic subunit p20 [Actinophytocola xinjiangensis]|uniref:Peptidase C14 caspase catalytic subunit p20 n=1 Tax=Actinophytocola xinjiangensis TaxID=485602 RepID=A0A7Z0WEF3_9PSEU|nr:caspase family protein [Actinophytocola xinjiangensis]OLF04783.1 peptidase C14 caspase catalytic subunit p20 [Actinophytocola xinjiangensis]